MIRRIAVKTVFSYLIGIAIAGVVFAFRWWSPHLLPQPPATPFVTANGIQEQMMQLDVVADAVDHTTSMLFSLTLGLFVLVGVVLRGDRAPTCFAHAANIASFICFALSSAIALYLAFLERLYVLHAANFVMPPQQQIEDIFGIHAVVVAISSIFAMQLAADYFLRKDKSKREPSGG